MRVPLPQATQNLAQVLRGQCATQLIDLYGDGRHITLNMRGFGDNANAIAYSCLMAWNILFLIRVI